MAIWFYSKTDGLEWLSNFTPSPFELDGETWPTVEHYYQVQKFLGTPRADIIRNALYASQAKREANRPSSRPDWMEVKGEVMLKALRAKFTQNALLAGLLLATGEEDLIHESPRDRFWGRNRDGEGENRLGEILMQVRGELRSA